MEVPISSVFDMTSLPGSGVTSELIFYNWAVSSLQHMHKHLLHMSLNYVWRISFIEKIEL